MIQGMQAGSGVGAWMVAGRRVTGWLSVGVVSLLAACAGLVGSEPEPVVPALRLMLSEALDAQPLHELHGRTVAGTVYVVAETNAAVTEVGFYLNAAVEPAAISVSLPFAFEFDTLLLDDGEHVLHAATPSGDGAAAALLTEAVFTVANESGDAPGDPPPGEDEPGDPPPGEELEERWGAVHAPFVEWLREAAPVAGLEAWDAQAFATFTRRNGAEVFRVPWFYAGDGVFALRFTGPRTGVYDVHSSSVDVPALDGLSGVVTIEANPDADAKGFLTSVGTAFAYRAGDGSVTRRTLYNVYMRHPAASTPDGVEYLADFYGDTAAARGGRIEALLTEAQEHGMQAVFVLTGGSWMSWPTGWGQTMPAGSDTPDPAAFEVLEDLLDRAHDRGMFVHIWKWADREQGHAAADLPGGTNGYADQRLQYYIAGRLGAYPNWSMSYGMDLEEWVTPAEVRAWHDTMTTLNSLPRVYMAREKGVHHAHDPLDMGADKLEVFSNDLRPESGFYGNARSEFEEVNDGMPVMYERRFLHTRDGVWDMVSTRRAIWQFTMAGGAAGIYGTMWGPGPDYPNPEQLATIARFWEHRFTADLQPHPSPPSGWVLRDGDTRHVVYIEHTNSVTIHVPAATAPAPIIAVDARTSYTELNLGTLDAGTHTITLPTTSDWALAIGHFPNAHSP